MMSRRCGGRVKTNDLGFVKTMTELDHDRGIGPDSVC
jgi:hypothetical protein